MKRSHRIAYWVLVISAFGSFFSLSTTTMAQTPAADSPRGAAAAYAAAVDSGDQAKAQQLAMSDADNQKLAGAEAGCSIVAERVFTTAIAKFGEEAKKQIKRGKTIAEKIADASEKQENPDTVVFLNANGRVISRVRRVQGVWKVDVASTVKEPAAIAESYNRMAQKLNHIGDDIRDGKYKSYAEVFPQIAGMMFEEWATLQAAQGGGPATARVEISPDEIAKGPSSATSAPSDAATGASPQMKAGAISLQESNFGQPEGAPAIELGKIVKLTASPSISDFFNSKAVVAGASVKNTGDKPMYCMLYLAFYDKDNNLIACMNQAVDEPLNPGAESQLSSCMAVVPRPQLKKIVKYQATFYESDKKF